MGQRQSKDELLYQQVNYGNVVGIRELRRQGAGLEWVDKDGKTPLIASCMNPESLNVAKTLLELGANANAYRPGRYAGTPLHHAAKRGLDNTVKLLLSHGANPLIINDDCQTPLDVARDKGFSNVVRTIEGHICLFSGWLREFYGPGILEALAPQLFTRKVWAVVLPCGARNPMRPYKLELAIYLKVEDAQPHTIIALWKAHLEETDSEQGDAIVTIRDNPSKVRIKLGCLHGVPKVQLVWFCNACKGIYQAPPGFLRDSRAQVTPATAPPLADDQPNASMQPENSERTTGIGESEHEVGPQNNSSYIGSSSSQTYKTSDSATPSAPPVSDAIVEDEIISYPAVDMTPLNFSAASTATESEKSQNVGISCVICLDAPVEGACIPCGHMAGCMSCLNEVKSKQWGCPVCRAKIDQVVRLYAV